MIGILDNNLQYVYDPCSLYALRSVNAVGAPACLYLAYRRCQLLLLQVSFIDLLFFYQMLEKLCYFSLLINYLCMIHT